MRRKRYSVLAGVAAAGLGIGIWAAIPGGSSSHAAASATASPATSASSGYAWYRSMIGSYSGGMMMGGSPGGQMMSPAGYQWMTGGAGAPGWMRGGTLPPAIMGTGTDPGKIMGRLWADAPGPRVSAPAADRLGSQIPAGARADRAADTLTFTGPAVQLTVLASPQGGRDETFRIAGMTNPAIAVRDGARVSIEVINADPDTAHGLVITASTVTSWMPMMTAQPAFPVRRCGSSVTRPPPGCTRAPSLSPSAAPAPTATCAPFPGTPRKA